MGLQNVSFAVDGTDTTQGKILTCAVSLPASSVDFWAPPLES